MKVTIDTDFDLEKIANSGQLFRAKHLGNGLYRFITGDNVLYITRDKNTDNTYTVNCDEGVWRDVWCKYFDLERDYRSIRKKFCGLNEFVDKALDYSAGLRILKQDRFECLISFIISQRKNIPSISSCIEKICHKFGKTIQTEYETIYTFPQVDELNKASLTDLNNLSLGYRAEYILDALNRIKSGEIDLQKLENLNDEELLKALMCINGVGIKVASCTALFSYNRLNIAPVDVWIHRAIDEYFDGINIFSKIQENSGILQQYVFYYIRSINKV